MYGFIKVGTACPKLKVGDIDYNLKNMLNCLETASNEGVKLLVFPELSTTGYTCGDLFRSKDLLENSNKALCEITRLTYQKYVDMLVAVGAPLYKNGILYNCAVIIKQGKILGVVPKSYIPNYQEFYEKRWFTEGLNVKNQTIKINGEKVPFGVDLVFASNDYIKFGFEVCEDLWVPLAPSTNLALAGANIIANLSASNEVVGKAEYRRQIVTSQSGKCACAYLYASSGVYESTSDIVFGGHMIVAENGNLLKENKRFQRQNEVLTAIIDTNKLNAERTTNISFRDCMKNDLGYREIEFEFITTEITNFDRVIGKHPFIPSNDALMQERCEEIFNIQCAALGKRLEQTGIKKAVIGISGGLDSTLAYLVMLKTFDMIGLSRKNIIAITMPGFGTTERTKSNATLLCEETGVDFRSIDITKACLQHFEDIGHDKNILDVTYENVQARERTQILMDVANKDKGILVGTGDLSELAIGWCTYNGDHMSMYAVNTSVPKTLVKYLVNYVAEFESEDKVKEILKDILGTPVSPELLPSDAKGNIAQITEDIVGPYELHDFFLYNFIKMGLGKEDILFRAKIAFKEDYEEKEIEKWYDIFKNRFYSSQFKRNCIPDGPKVGTISLSPRGDWRMPSDTL